MESTNLIGQTITELQNAVKKTGIDFYFKVSGVMEQKKGSNESTYYYDQNGMC